MQIYLKSTHRFMRYRANKKYHADADANADANRIHTENLRWWT